MKVVIIAGSSRNPSLSLRVALHLQSETLKRGWNIQLLNLQIEKLPFIQNVWTKAELVPSEKKYLWNAMNEAQAFIIVSPEYNGAYSSAMKNLIDYFPKSTYHRKAFGIVTSSEGYFGGMRAAMQLQFLSIALTGIPSPTMLVTTKTPEKFNEHGELIDVSFAIQVKKFIDELEWLGSKLSS